MLRVLSDLKGYTIAGSDGEIGAVRRFFFEDEHWVVRHIVVDVGSWFSRHRVLISPAAVERIDDEQRRLVVGLTRERVRTSPDIDTDKPVSRQHETALNSHYGYTPYWGGAGPWAGGYHPYALLAPSAVPTPAPPDAPAGGGSGDPRLRSTKELSGYRLRAGDVAAGRVDDFIVDDESWAVRYLTIDTGTKPGGRRVLMPASWVREIDWSRQQVSVDGSAERVRNRPEYRPGELAVLARQTKEERVYHVNEIIGKSVVTTGAGEKLGTVADALFDTDARRLVGFVIGNGVLATERVLPLGDVETIGRDTVLVRTSEHMMSPREWRHADTSAVRCSHLKGRRVVTADGREIGHAHDLLVEEGGGALSAIEVEERWLGGLRHRLHIMGGPPPPQIGPDVIVVAA